MKYFVFFALLFVLALKSSAEDVSIHKNMFRTTYETVTLPQNEAMGLIGLDYLFDTQKNIYYGLGGYGALTGECGGFFTLGIEAGYQYNVTDSIALDAGLFVGGGGGGRGVSGDGLMLRPHVGALYDAKSYKLGAYYSKVKFPGKIDSDQIGVQADIPFETLHVSTTDKDAIRKGLSRLGSQYDFDWSSYYFSGMLQTYKPTTKARYVSGEPLQQTITLVGIEMGKYLDPSWFAYADVSGAARGGVGGYMDGFGGLGYRWLLAQNIALKAKASIGSGGGGNVDTGGGFMYKGSVGASFFPTKKLSLDLETGYVDAPDGAFSAMTTRFLLSHNFNVLDISSGGKHAQNYEDFESKKWQLRVGSKRYLASSTLRTDKGTDPIDLISVKIDRFVNNNFYFTGQTDWAYSGYVGGYAVGMLGMGYNTEPIYKQVSIYAELLGGAGAGGGVATEGGALVQPMAGLTFNINKQLNFQAGVGKVIAKSGTLNTTVVDAAIIYKFHSIEPK